MVIRWLLDAFLNMLDWLTSWLPSSGSIVTQVSSFADDASGVLGAVMNLNNVFPVSEMVTALGLFATIYLGIHAGNLIRRVISIFTGGGGS